MSTLEFSLPWITLLMLGLFHGINPGMGWLFAVGLGLQEQRRSAVWAALLPLALGHTAAIGATILAAEVIGLLVPLHVFRYVVAAVLVGMGLYQLLRGYHPRYGGMQVGARELVIWSFLMATAHGAGLMVLPFVVRSSHAMAHGPAVGHGEHAGMLASLPQEPMIGLAAAVVHTVGYLVVMGLVAVVVYEKVGLRLLRSAWVNLDLIWAAALILTGLVTVLP